MTQNENSKHKMPTPLLKNIEQVSDGWLKKYVLTYELPNGTTIEYESVSRKAIEEYSRELYREEGFLPRTDAVSIVPRTVDDEIVLIKEFRYPLNSWCIAFPAGLIEPGENLLSCVSRELKEETGYGLKSIDGAPKYHPLAQPGYSSTGMSEESVHIVYAFVEKIGEPELEPTEFIEVFTVKINDVPRFLAENTIPMGTRCQLILESFSRDSRRHLDGDESTD